MYTASVALQITNFVPLNGGAPGAQNCTQASFGPVVPTSPGADAVFSNGSGSSITVTPPPGYTGSARITFQLPDPTYVLLGVAFTAPTAGRSEFRTVSIDRDRTGSQLSITDACLPAPFSGIDYQFVILVQQIGSNLIGAIDPDITTDTNE